MWRPAMNNVLQFYVRGPGNRQKSFNEETLIAADQSLSDDGKLNELIKIY
jgi:hypothetical protein